MPASPGEGVAQLERGSDQRGRLLEVLAQLALPVPAEDFEARGLVDARITLRISVGPGSLLHDQMIASGANLAHRAGPGIGPELGRSANSSSRERDNPLQGCGPVSDVPHDRAMHRFRINLCGSDADVVRATERLQELGGLPIGASEPSCWTWAAEEGWEAIVSVSREHPSLLLAVEGFEDFSEQIVAATVIDGELTQQGSRTVLPEGWGSFHDEDGRPIDGELLVAAGRAVAEDLREPHTGGRLSGLQMALLLGEELGRFAADTRDFTVLGAPSENALDGAVRLAQLCVQVSVSARARTPGELNYLVPLRITQSVIHAGKSDYLDAPGNADWPEWLGLLLGSAGSLIDEVHMFDLVPPGPDPALCPGLTRRDPGEGVEYAARSVVTSCVQALALFGSQQVTAPQLRESAARIRSSAWPRFPVSPGGDGAHEQGDRG